MESRVQGPVSATVPFQQPLHELQLIHHNDCAGRVLVQAARSLLFSMSLLAASFMHETVRCCRVSALFVG